MPLIKSTKKSVIGKNIATEVKAGKPVKQAAAIAYSEQRRAKRGTSEGFMPSRPRVGDRRSSSDRPSHGDQGPVKKTRTAQ